MQTEIAGYSFKNLDLMQKAFRHRSSVRRDTESNERLELLGDAVLELSLTDILFHRFPSIDEGSLSKRRASLVNAQSLHQLAIEHGLDHYAQFGKGEREDPSRLGPKVLSSVFEALIGAMYLDSDFDTARNWLANVFETRIGELDGVEDFVEDFKSRLQEKVQSELKTLPRYLVIDEGGPSHAREFTVEVWLEEKRLGVGMGRSKKVAEQQAARMALEEVYGEK